MIRLAALLILLPASALAEEIVLGPGSYPAQHINGRQGVSYRCSQPGACSMGAGTTVYNSDNVTIDGFRIAGGSQGVMIAGSNHVTLTHNTFQQQQSAGVSVQPGAVSRNVRIVDNSFVNHATGCNYLDSSNCSGQLANGNGVVAFMDYGARLYACQNCDISGNTFSSIFNHAISLKFASDAVRITDNTFNGCGRSCIVLGQERNRESVGSVLVEGNRLLGAFRASILAWNVRNAQIGSNIIGGQAQDGGGGDWSFGPIEPPYVYVPPDIEDPEARRQRILAEGGPGHSCCDDLSAAESSKASSRLERLRQQWAAQ